MPASRVSRKPCDNNRQERKDAVSGRDCGAAGNTLARQQDRTERRSSHLGGKPQCVVEQRKSIGSHRLANFATLPAANVEVTRTTWHGQHAIVVTIENVHPRGKNGKGRDCLAEQLVKTWWHGATPALDNMREGIAHREDQSVRKVDPNRRDLEKRVFGRVGVHQRPPFRGVARDHNETRK